MLREYFYGKKPHTLFPFSFDVSFSDVEIFKIGGIKNLVVKSLATLNVKGHGKVPYQQPWLKSMAHGVHLHITQCISAMRCANLM